MGCDRGVGRVVVPILQMKKQRLRETDYLAWVTGDDCPFPHSFSLASPWIPKGPAAPWGPAPTLSGPPGPSAQLWEPGRHPLSPAGESGSGSGRRARGPQAFTSREQPGPPSPIYAGPLGCPLRPLPQPSLQAWPCPLRAARVPAGEDLLLRAAGARGPGPQRALPHRRR